MDEFLPVFLTGLLVGAFIAWISLAFLAAGLDNSWRDQIVSHGNAEYYLDQNHDRQWRWIDHK